MRLTNRTRQLRRAAGLTIEQLAYDAGLSPVTIRRLETSDHLGHTPLATVVRIAAALGVGPADLLPALGSRSTASRTQRR